MLPASSAPALKTLPIGADRPRALSPTRHLGQRVDPVGLPGREAPVAVDDERPAQWIEAHGLDPSSVSSKGSQPLT